MLVIVNMNKNFKTNYAFSLIEIIVVLVILGVVASIAVPTYFSFVKRSRVAELFVTMNDVKSRVMACIYAHSDDVGSNCNSNSLRLIQSGDFYYLTNINPIQRIWSTLIQCNPTICNPTSPNGITMNDMVYEMFDFNGNRSICVGWGAFSGNC